MCPTLRSWCSSPSKCRCRQACTCRRRRQRYRTEGGACGHCKEVIKDIIDTYYQKLAKEENAPLSEAQRILKIGKIIDTQIAAELQKDGGDITLQDIQGNKVYVKLRGKCSGCKNSMMTLKGFVENTLKNAVDKNIEVIEV